MNKQHNKKVKSFIYHFLTRFHNTINKKHHTFSLTLLLLYSINSFSQTTSYGFMNFYDEKYYPITNGTVLTATFTGTNPANYYTNIPIGFRFKFNEKNYTKVGVAPDGYIWFGNTVPPVGVLSQETTPISTNMGVEGIISALGMSLHHSNMGDAAPAIVYKTKGDAPFRIFTVEWKDASSFKNKDDERLSFQINLYETYNNIELLYDTLVINHNLNDTAEIGIKGSNLSDFNNLIINNWSNPILGNNVDDKSIFNANNRPGKGLVYTFYRNDNYMAMVSPNGGEHFFAGSTIDIQFQFGLDKAEDFELYFSADSGANYTLIKEAFDPTSPANQPLVSITLPNVNSTKCFIKVVGVTTGISDSNDVAFSVSTTTGLATRKSNYNLEIYPNPASSYIHIDANYLEEDTYVLLYDVTGKLVKQVAAEKYVPISVEDLNVGLYFLKVISDKNTYTTKLTINK